MPRRKAVSFKRDVGVDIRFKSSVVQKLINTVLKRGKKSVAQAIVNETFDILGKKAGGDEKKAFSIFEKALANIQPALELKSRRVGGGIYQIPVEIRSERAQALAFRWLLKAASARGDKTMGKRIAAELLDASEGRGSAIKKKIEIHKMAEANRAFAHYAW